MFGKLHLFNKDFDNGLKPIVMKYHHVFLKNFGLTLVSFFFISVFFTANVLAKCPSLTINKGSIKYGTEQGKNFIQRKNNTFKAGETAIIMLPVQGFKEQKYKIAVGGDLILSYQGRTINTLYDFLGNTGQKVFLGDRKIKKFKNLIQTQVRIPIIIPIGLSGEIKAQVEIKDMNEPCRKDKTTFSFFVTK